ncbi:NAD-dependent succinate-semialdehyde dehydrogenase [Aequorivita lipolytica]|uniref:NAD-dependent succinate-semialdehyde dehydrogenase n=1 Tax=Aequorivita lipolytica TaxID=153267 RepID=A0A5C6YP99_9FLAO|nr:NAD-dependent succinate-semialdehyde dehydrogenase [Aequorivita lipolytica]TXD69163.1 NAD-dependent succinate-semialdehyde dehydrogenase [Aequorivita lipolytica]SRX51256.1 Succinate-semialdehyde dehydrogenase [NADP(+)] 1 [Aequorivita lipolytica]
MATTLSINPYTDEELQSYKNHTKKEVSEIIDKADKRFYNWRETSFSERKKLMLAAASELKKNKQEYAKTMTLEMGKPITQAIAEVEKCAWVCEYYAENAEKHLENERVKTDAHKSYVSYEPLGVVLAIMPWNYPFWQVFRFAAPALMAGNIGILKHASNVFGSALNIEKVFKRAGFPENCFTTLLVGSDAVEEIIENEKVKAVTLTGSGPAGSSVASIAGKNIKKSVLELGGNNALVIMKDCEMDKTIETCVQARFQNTGQSCIAGKRLIIDASISEEFVEKMLVKVRELKSGDPMDEETYVGTMARADLAKDLEKQVNDSIKAGAKLEIGGKRQGAYFEPTILTNVNEGMSVFKEETFGPVLSVTTFKTVEEAVALSNNSKFGLGVSIFTKNIEEAEKLAFQFDEGAVFINELVKSDPRLPFGGIKQSGYGRELSDDGIKEFVNRKTVYINT